MKSSRLAWLLAAAVLAATPACSGGGNGSSSSPSPKATNTIGFPIFDGAEVLANHAWRQTITPNSNAGDSALLRQGAGTYQGHDVVAGTQAMMPALEGWLGDLAAHPPAGYSVLTASGVDDVRAHTRDLGIDFVVFEGMENGKHRAVAVLAVDPQTLDQKAGPMLRMIGKFRLLPTTLREGIDAQAKKETGFTATEITDPGTPIGAAVASLDELRDFGGRGVVLIDATKQ